VAVNLNPISRRKVEGGTRRSAMGVSATKFLQRELWRTIS
jgi:hypothetical protein